MFWTSSFLTTSSIMISATINKLEYKIGDAWKDGTLKSISTDGDKHIFVFEIPAAESGTITGIRLIDKYGKVAGEKAENIIKAAGNSFLARITMYMHEA